MESMTGYTFYILPFVWDILLPVTKYYIRLPTYIVFAVTLTLDRRDQWLIYCLVRKTRRYTVYNVESQVFTPKT